MKRYLFYITSAIALLLSVSSCGKDQNEEISNPNENTTQPEDKSPTYYIKYEATIASPYYLGDISVETETGHITFDGTRLTSFSEIFGPVSKGFNAAISISARESVSNVSIHISRGSDPFALKATGSTYTSYKIDY